MLKNSLPGYLYSHMVKRSFFGLSLHPLLYFKYGTRECFDKSAQIPMIEECGGSVVECSSLDRGVAGSILTGGTALCP